MLVHRSMTIGFGSVIQGEVVSGRERHSVAPCALVDVVAVGTYFDGVGCSEREIR